MFKEIWTNNVKKLLHEHGYNLTDAATMLGTSKQYLSAILGETEPSSTKETIMERLCFLLHTTPDRLYAVSHGKPEGFMQPVETEFAMPPVELAILSERFFLSGEYEKAYTCSSALLERHANDLSPAARAQSHLLAGKSGCLAGYPEQAKVFLRRSLQLFQKRLSAQPDKYLPLCIDCYRYLGLASSTSGSNSDAVRWLTRACVLASKHPLLMKGMQGKMEEVVANLLRSAVRRGTRKEFDLAEISAESMAKTCSFFEIACSIQRERLFVSYPLAGVRGEISVFAAEHGSELESLHLSDVTKWDPMHIVHYSLLLVALKDSEKLDLLYKKLEQRNERQWPLRLLVARQLTLLGHNNGTFRETVVDERGISPIMQALLWVLQGLELEAAGMTSAAHYSWQLALDKIKRQREVPLYAFVLNWYINTVGQLVPGGDLDISARLLKQAVSEWEGAVWE